MFKIQLYLNYWPFFFKPGQSGGSFLDSSVRTQEPWWWSHSGEGDKDPGGGPERAISNGRHKQHWWLSVPPSHAVCQWWEKNIFSGRVHDGDTASAFKPENFYFILQEIFLCLCSIPTETDPKVIALLKASFGINVSFFSFFKHACNNGDSFFWGWLQMNCMDKQESLALTVYHS